MALCSVILDRSGTGLFLAAKRKKEINQMKLSIITLLGLLFACGGQPGEDDPLGTVEQQFGDRQTNLRAIGTQPGPDGFTCNAAALNQGPSTHCNVLDTGNSSQTVNFYHTKIDNTGTAAWPSAYLQYVQTGLTAANAGLNATGPGNVFQLWTTVTSGQNITIKPGNLAGPEGSTNMHDFVRVAHSSCFTLVEHSTDLAGIWSSCNQCTITMDAVRLVSHSGPPASDAHDRVRQAMAHAMMECQGLGAQDLFHSPSYTNTHLSPSVWSLTNYFTPAEKCLAATVGNSFGAGAGNIIHEWQVPGFQPACGNE